MSDIIKSENLGLVLTFLIFGPILLLHIFKIGIQNLRDKRHEEIERVVRLHLPGQAIAMCIDGDHMDKLNGVYRIGRVISYGSALWEGEVEARGWNNVVYRPYGRPIEEVTLGKERDIYPGVHVKFVKYLRVTKDSSGEVASNRDNE